MRHRTSTDVNDCCDPAEPGETAVYLERYPTWGMTRGELQSGKPIIGIAQSGSELTPCNRIHLALAERVILSKTVAPVGGAVMETAGGVMSDAPPVSSWAGTLTRKASRRLPPVLLVQMKYWPVTSRLPLGYFE